MIHGLVGEDVQDRLPRGPSALHDKRPHAELRRHQPHQTPGQRLCERATVKGLFLWRKQQHHPRRVVDGPIAAAAAGGDGSPERVLQLAPFECRINASLGDSAGEIRSKDKTLGFHQRCSLSHRLTRARGDGSWLRP